ncbi:toxic anion resistance protein [Aerococcaceae bacterium DSM 111020]|nr:toxic anion resistance protein [Aerococcaceae bacterium DSM 111020]
MLAQETSGVDDLLANPFDSESETPASYDKDLADAEILARREITTEKLMVRLPAHRQEQAQNLAAQIDENDMGAVLAYGSNAQKKLSEFSREILSQVQVKDTGEIGDSLTELMTQLKATDPRSLTAEPNFFSKLFGRVRRSIDETQLQYQKIGSQIDRIAIRLEREKNELLNDNRMLERFYEKNKDYFEALNVYIAASEVKLQEIQEQTIPEAIQEAHASQDQMAVQKVHDLNQFLDRLDKRTHDLRLTRQMTIQQAPQIRLIQNTNQALAEKIHVSIHTAIPLWENQITIALALLRQQQAATSQRMVSETTNDLLLKNSEMLKQSTVDVARETERGVVDLQTLQQSQRNLVDALQETLEIQETGRQQRQHAEIELREMEDELRDQLLMISNERRQRDFKENHTDPHSDTF